MQLSDSVADFGKALRTGLDEQQPLPARLHLALPAVDRFYPGNDVHACGYLVLDKMARDLAGFFFRSRRREDDSFVSHIKSAVGPYCLNCIFLNCAKRVAAARI